MLRVLIACGAGMSSSMLTQKVQNECKEKGFDDRYYFEFQPMGLMKNEQEALDTLAQYDVVMLCPHMRLEAKKWAPKVNVPLYILPPAMYGTMIFEEVMTEAQDIYDRYQANPTKEVFRFPGEPENTLKIRRKTAYKNTPKK